jgi:hypothetical protein
VFWSNPGWLIVRANRERRKRVPERNRWPCQALRSSRKGLELPAWARGSRCHLRCWAPLSCFCKGIQDRNMTRRGHVYWQSHGIGAWPHQALHLTSSWAQKRKSHSKKAETFLEAETTITHALCSCLYFLGSSLVTRQGRLGGVVFQKEIITNILGNWGQNSIGNWGWMGLPSLNIQTLGLKLSLDQRTLSWLIISLAVLPIHPQLSFQELRNPLAATHTHTHTSGSEESSKKILEIQFHLLLYSNRHCGDYSLPLPAAVLLHRNLPCIFSMCMELDLCGVFLVCTQASREEEFRLAVECTAESVRTLPGLKSTCVSLNVYCMIG